MRRKSLPNCWCYVPVNYFQFTIFIGPGELSLQHVSSANQTLIPWNIVSPQNLVLRTVGGVWHAIINHFKQEMVLFEMVHRPHVIS